MSDEFDNLLSKAMPLFFVMALLAGIIKALHFLFIERTTDLFLETMALFLFGVYGLRLVYNQSKTLKGICKAIHISILSGGAVCVIYGACVSVFGFTTTTGYIPRSEGVQALIAGGGMIAFGGILSLISKWKKRGKKKGKSSADEF